MMLAERENVDIPHDNHFLVVFFEHGLVEDVAQLLLVSFGHVEQSLCVSLWGLEQTFPHGILADALKQGLYSTGQFRSSLLFLSGSFFKALEGSLSCMSRQRCSLCVSHL